MFTTLASRMAPARRNAPVIHSGSIWSGPGVRRFIVALLPVVTRSPPFGGLLIGRRRCGESHRHQPWHRWGAASSWGAQISTSLENGLGKFEPDRQALRPVYEQGLRHPRLAGEFDRFPARQEP